MITKVLSLVCVSILWAVVGFGAELPPLFQTKDGVMHEYDDRGPFIRLPIPNDSVGNYNIYVYGTDHKGGFAMWLVDMLIGRIEDKTPISIIGIDTFIKHGTKTAEPWEIELSGSSGELILKVKGETGKTVDWLSGVNNFRRVMVGTYVGP